MYFEIVLQVRLHQARAFFVPQERTVQPQGRHLHPRLGLHRSKHQGSRRSGRRPLEQVSLHLSPSRSCHMSALTIPPRSLPSRAPALLPFLDAMTAPDRKINSPFMLPISEKYNDLGTIVVGKIESGRIYRGDTLMLMPNRVSPILRLPCHIAAVPSLTLLYPADPRRSDRHLRRGS